MPCAIIFHLRKTLNTRKEREREREREREKEKERRDDNKV
jgi:hypothetical protein